jgi:hypothetical protein
MPTRAFVDESHPGMSGHSFRVEAYDTCTDCHSLPEMLQDFTAMLMLDPERDFWGERKTERDVVRQWQQHPHVRNLYVFCLNDPVNNIDLDGHSAWWFFLTIPSSLTWALPNTAIALMIIVGNLLMEIIGWVVWLVICIGKKEFANKGFGRKDSGRFENRPWKKA